MIWASSNSGCSSATLSTLKGGTLLSSIVTVPARVFYVRTRRNAHKTQTESAASLVALGTRVLKAKAVYGLGRKNVINVICSGNTRESIEDEFRQDLLLDSHTINVISLV